MKVSTRARYGLRLMLRLAPHHGKGLIHLKDIAREENISEKYLSQLIIPLKTSGLVTSGQGVHGGYMLAKNPKQITVREIVEPLEGVSLLSDCIQNPLICQRSSSCIAQNVWITLQEKILETLDGITLSALMHAPKKKRKQKGRT